MPTLTVIGLGYVGLPLAVQAANKGYKVFGVDLSQTLIDKVNSRTTPYVNDVRFEAALKIVPPEQLVAGTDYAVVEDSDVIVICVPTPTDSNVPDLTYVYTATANIAKHLHAGQLVVLESTVNPGVTRDGVLPIIEKTSGLRVGGNIFLAHCPERIDPGNPKWFVGNLNRVVGGITAECTRKASEFYRSIIDAEIIPLDSTEEAEFTKSWENSHRNVMIALANEAAVICDSLGMDVANVLRGLQSKVDQFGLKLASPGIGPGGHCIPEDIHYVIRKARQSGIDTRLLDSAADLNDKMPKYAVQSICELVREHGEHITDLKVGLLGLAYKENIDDARRSPAIEVAYYLAQKAKSVYMHDPYVEPANVRLDARFAKHTRHLDELLSEVDVLFIATGHNIYKETITPEILKSSGIKYVLDGRNCLNKKTMLAQGIVYKGIGR